MDEKQLRDVLEVAVKGDRLGLDQGPESVRLTAEPHYGRITCGQTM